MIKAIFLKKIKRYFYSSFRFINKKNTNKIILINSIPKSGTYLLHQILNSISFLNDYGLFVASRPTLTYKKRSSKKITSFFERIYKDEFILGHVEYSLDIEKFLKKNNAVKILLIRDPRDVVVSESHYLTYLNHFHKLSKSFKSLLTQEERVNYAIYGDVYLNTKYDFLPIIDRYESFIKWTKNTNCFVIKYEELIDCRRDKVIIDLLNFLTNSLNISINTSIELKKIKNSLATGRKGHTFRLGKSQIWKNILTKEQKNYFKSRMGKILRELNYDN